MYNEKHGILRVCWGRHKYQVDLQMTETVMEVINGGKLTARLLKTKAMGLSQLWIYSAL